MKCTSADDPPISLNSIFGTIAFILYLMLTNVLFCPLADSTLFIIGTSRDPGANVVGTFAFDLTLFKGQVEMHPATLGTMAFDIESGPFAGDEVAAHEFNSGFRKLNTKSINTTREVYFFEVLPGLRGRKSGHRTQSSYYF